MEIKKKEKTCFGAEKAWEALKSSYRIWKEGPNSDSLCFHPDRKGDYITNFQRYYDTIKEDFMTSDTTELDAHKQAAIMVISALEAKAVTQTCTQDMVAFGPYAVALDVALSYLVECINDRLKKISQPIKELKLPIALACDTSYFDIMCRVLYYEDPTTSKNGIGYSMKYNIIEWSDRFFLLEYITLLENHIDPVLMKEKYWD